MLSKFLFFHINGLITDYCPRQGLVPTASYRFMLLRRRASRWFPICSDSIGVDSHWFIHCLEDIGYPSHHQVKYLILITVHLVCFIWPCLEVFHTEIWVLSYISQLLRWIIHLCLTSWPVWIIVSWALIVYWVFDNVGLSMQILMEVVLEVRPECMWEVILLLCSTGVRFWMGYFKDVWIITSGGVMSRHYYQVALIKSASCYQNCVSCWLTFLSFSCNSSIMIHMAAMSESLGSSSSPRLLFTSYFMSTMNCFFLQSVSSYISSCRSTIIHWVRIGVTQLSSDLRFFMLNGILVKYNPPCTILLNSVVDH